MSLPASLQSLKDRAASVREEAKSVADEGAENWWQILLAAAEISLGKLWQYVEKKRPWNFRHGSHPHGADSTCQFEFRILLPGHRPIFARFHGCPVGTHDMQGKYHPPSWHRSTYSGMVTDDVDHGTAFWMAESRPNRQLNTYHRTLGSAILAAEIAAK